MTTITTQAV